MDLDFKQIKQKINDHLSIFTILLTAAVYFIGYAKYYFLFRKLGINTPVTDVYPILSIFVSGISMLISFLYVPLVSFALVFWIKQSKVRTSFSGLGFFLIVAASIPLFFRGFMFTPFSRLTVLSFVVLIVAACYVLDKLKKLNRNALIIILLCWVLSICTAYYISLPSSETGYFFLNVSSRTNQDSGISGYLVTDYILSPDTTQNDFHSDSTPYYQTYGILLSIHDGNYYFYTNDRLYILPESGILLFNQYLH